MCNISNNINNSINNCKCSNNNNNNKINFIRNLGSKTIQIQLKIWILIINKWSKIFKMILKVAKKMQIMISKSWTISSNLNKDKKRKIIINLGKLNKKAQEMFQVNKVLKLYLLLIKKLLR